MRESSFKRGFGLGAGAGLGAGLLLTITGLVGSLLSGLLLLGFSSAAASLGGTDPTELQGEETVWGKPTATKKLKAIGVTGPILTSGESGGLTLGQSTYGYEVADVLDKLEATDADGVVLMMDTPGGTVTGSQAMSDAIDRYRQRTGKKVYAFVTGMSASGGMWTMAGADEVIADHGTSVGSVGVIMGPLERYTNVTSAGSLLTGEVTAERIESRYITAGKGKDFGNPFREATPEEIAITQRGVDRMYEQFVNHVSTKRGIDRAVLVDQVGAALLDAETAKEVGYVDDVMGREQALRRFAEASGLDPNDTRVVQATAPGPFASLFGVEQRVWGVAPAAVPVQGQPARATAPMCSDVRTPLVFHGSVVGVCR